MWAIMLLVTRDLLLSSSSYSQFAAQKTAQTVMTAAKSGPQMVRPATVGMPVLLHRFLNVDTLADTVVRRASVVAAS
jgi:hypothetical protein